MSVELVLALLFSFVLLPCVAHWTREAQARDRTASEAPAAPPARRPR
jgi:hypothetical protein